MVASEDAERHATGWVGRLQHLAEQQEGIEVLALVASGDDDNPQLTARMTSGMRDRVTALVPDITFQ